MRVPLLDTHACTWYVAEPTKLERREIEALDALDSRPFISDLSLWEVATLVNLRRLDLQPSFEHWLSQATRPGVVRILPLTTEIAVELASLRGKFHRDPADRVIVATARTHRLPLLTRDKRILASGLVQRWKPGQR